MPSLDQHSSLIQSIQDRFAGSLDSLYEHRELLEFIWKDLKPTLGTQNQDLIDLFFVANLLLTDRFDCVVEVGRGGGTITSVVYGIESRRRKFISICPQPTFLAETLPELQQRFPTPGDGHALIIQGLLQEIPLLRMLRDYNSILLLFDGDHSQPFAKYYLNRIVEPLLGKELLIGVHDIYRPDIQPRTRPNQWDDPDGPYFAKGYACRWNEVIPVLEFIEARHLPLMHTGQWYAELMRERPAIPEYWRSISRVEVPPYSGLWPFDGQAGTWLFFDGNGSQSFTGTRLNFEVARQAVTTSVRHLRERGTRYLRGGVRKLLSAREQHGQSRSWQRLAKSSR